MGASPLGKVIVLPLLRFFAWFYYLLPASGRLCSGRALGWVIRGAGWRAKVVRENLSYAFPGNESSELRQSLMRKAYEHLGHLALEILLLFGPMKRFALKNAEVRGLENWEKAKAQNKGVIILSSHVGNWEVMAAAGGLGGIDILLVTKHLKPEWLHQAIESGRATCGVAATYEPRTFRDILFHLKRKGTVGIVLDQYAGPPVGVRVPFFGVPVGTNTVLAMLAKRTGAPVLPAVNYRTPEGKFVIEIQPVLEWEPGTEPALELPGRTASYVAVLESHIRAHPEQWLWMHRRFKGDLSPLRDGEWLEGRSRT